MAPDAKTRFTGRAEAYSRYRPAYPDEILPLLAAEAGLRSESIVADIGSGTGLLTALFLENGNSVLAVEPNADMRARAESTLSHYCNFISMNGSAESTGLPDSSIDLIVSGQAFHWFSPPEAKREFRRISRNGNVAIVYNTRQIQTDGMGADYEALVSRFGRNFSSARGPVEETLHAFFEEYRIFTLPNPRQLDFDGLKGRILSASYMPTEGEAGYEEMIAAAGEVFRKYQRHGIVTMDLTTEIFLGKV